MTRPFHGDAIAVLKRGLIALVALAAWTGAAAAGMLYPFERGRAIYEGRDQGAATAIVAGISAPLSRFACARCHGADAEGRLEGGAYAPPLRLDRLTRATVGYDAASLEKAIAEGVAPDGRVLARAMPRFRFRDPEDVQALLVYLAGVAADQRRGFGPDAIALRVPSAEADVRASAFAKGLKDALATELPNGAWGLPLSFDQAGPDGDAKGPCFAAVGTAAQGCAITLFPLEGLTGGETGDARGLFASDLAQLQALVAHRPEGGVILVGGRPRDRMLADLLAPRLARDLDPARTPKWRFVSSVEVAPSRSEAALIVGGVDELPMLLRRLQGFPRLFGMDKTFAPWRRALRSAGYDGFIADPRPPGASADAGREGFVAGRLIATVVKQCGGRCTRARFLDLFDRQKSTWDDWRSLDYAKIPLSGTDAVDIRPLGEDVQN